MKGIKTLAVTVLNKKQEQLFTSLAQELGLDISEAKFKPLTTKDVALGVGRPFTNEELIDYTSRHPVGKTKTAKEVNASLKARLAQRRKLQ